LNFDRPKALIYIPELFAGDDAAAFYRHNFFLYKITDREQSAPVN